MTPLNLPDKLDLDGSFEKIFATLYLVFKADFIDGRAFYQGVPIVFDNKKVDSEYEEGFWNLVTRGKNEYLISSGPNEFPGSGRSLKAIPMRISYSGLSGIPIEGGGEFKNTISGMKGEDTSSC